MFRLKTSHRLCYIIQIAVILQFAVSGFCIWSFSQ